MVKPNLQELEITLPSYRKSGIRLEFGESWSTSTFQEPVSLSPKPSERDLKDTSQIANSCLGV